MGFVFVGFVGVDGAEAVGEGEGGGGEGVGVGVFLVWGGCGGGGNVVEGFEAEGGVVHLGELVGGVVEGAAAFVGVGVGFGRVGVGVGGGCGAGGGVGGAVGCVGEGVGFFSRSSALLGAYHLQGLGLEAALWRRRRVG